MAKRTHIFVCHGALSLDAAKRIAKDLTEEDQAHCHFLLLFDGSRVGIPNSSTVSAMSPPPHAYSEWTRPLAIARWFSGWLKSHDNALGEVHAYIPHPFELPGNYFLFSPGAAQRIDLLPDGLINYYDHSVRPESLRKALRLRVRVTLRKLAATFSGLSYTPYTDGHLTLYERELYATSWTYNPRGFLSISGKLTRLPQRPRRQTENSDDQIVLILDQEVHHVLSKELENKARSALVGEAKALQGTRLLYKGHPRGKNRATQLQRAGLNVEDITGPHLAEDVVEGHGVTAIIGFYSTPLILSAENVPVRRSVLPSPDTRGVLLRERVRLIRDALGRAGVEFTRLNN